MFSRFFLSVLILLALSSCSSSKYEKVVERELSRSVRFDDLFMGLKFGQTETFFYEYCRQQNQKGIFMQGAMNGSIAVQYRIEELTYPATMDFYPLFNKGKIYEIRSKVKYNAWAPWNKHLFADRLLPDLIQLFKKWYGGNDFVLMEIDKKTLWVKIDGNRQISMSRADDLFVDVNFTDMSVETKTTE